MTLKETEDYITSSILVHYDEDEARAIAKIELQHLTGYDNVHYSLHYRQEIQPGLLPLLSHDLERIEKGEPIQYITGVANFYGYDFMVTPDVLIPRKETEELVECITRDNKASTGVVILDIGTGSGCIAITLKKLMQGASVFALDSSKKALELAQKNAILLNADIEFVHADILSEWFPVELFDIIVSNPPYISESEKNLIHKNVLEHEPHSALFVPDNDPLLFYKKITDLAADYLKPGGNLYYEIHETQGAQIRELLESRGFSRVQIIRDMQGKDRIAMGTKLPLS